MTRGELIFPVAVLAAIVALLGLGNFYYQYGWTAFAFPLLVGIAICILCAIEIVVVLRGRRAPVAAGSDIDSADDDELRLSLPAAAWMFALVVFLYVFGFVFGAAIYLLACLRANGFSWMYAGVVALASMLVTWGLFMKILGILLSVEPLWLAS